MAVLGVEFRRGFLRGAAAGVDGDHVLAGDGDEPEAVAADGGHVRIDDRQRRRHGDGGFEGGAVLAQHAQARFAGEMMRRRNHAAA